MLQPQKNGMPYIIKLLIIAVATFLYVYISLNLFASSQSSEPINSKQDAKANSSDRN